MCVFRVVRKKKEPFWHTIHFASNPATTGNLNSATQEIIYMTLTKLGLSLRYRYNWEPRKGKAGDLFKYHSIYLESSEDFSPKAKVCQICFLNPLL